MPIQFVFPMPPNLTNRASGRSHWRVIHREKKQYAAQLDALQAAGMLPRPPASPFTKVRITSTMYLGARMDVDNAIARHKVALDWLATRGYVVNDCNVEWSEFPRQIVRRGQEYRIAITMEAA